MWRASRFSWSPGRALVVITEIQYQIFVSRVGLGDSTGSSRRVLRQHLVSGGFLPWRFFGFPVRFLFRFRFLFLGPSCSLRFRLWWVWRRPSVCERQWSLRCAPRSTSGVGHIVGDRHVWTLAVTQSNAELLLCWQSGVLRSDEADLREQLSQESP